LLLVVMLALAGGCQDQNAGGGGLAAPQSPAASSPTLESAAPSATPSPPPAAQDLAGHWRGRNNVLGADAYLQVDGPTVRIVYDHDDGRIVATLLGVHGTGWWSEAPTRTASQDAGDVEFTVAREAGTIAISGRWRYGTSGNFSSDRIELVWADATIPPVEAAKFADQASFVPHP
jgi:hypothetical protein